jgi:hypothetical protein
MYEAEEVILFLKAGRECGGDWVGEDWRESREEAC